MYLKMGNLTVAEFAERVGAEFTKSEVEFLESKRSPLAAFTDSQAFHIYDNPVISIHVGSDNQPVLDVFKAANSRKPFNREVGFYPEQNATRESEEGESRG